MISYLHNRLLVPGIIINTLPKSGTNLLIKAVNSFTGVRDSGTYVRLATALDYADQDLSSAVTVPVGLACPKPAPLSAVEAVLDRVGPGQFTRWHVPYAEATAQAVRARSLRMLLMIRDPRDVVVSQTHYAIRNANHNLHALYTSLPLEECIALSINGVDDDRAGGYGTAPIGERCRALLQWQTAVTSHLVRFERLVGEQGGGSHDAQIAELTRTGEFLGLRFGPAEVQRIAAQLFGGTNTFRQGQIGGWREAFTEAHKQAFKASAGDLLVELGYEQDLEW